VRLPLATLILITGCAAEPVHLEAPGVSVEITRDPFALSVRDGSGREVLASSDAMGLVAWTSGRLEWGQTGSLGSPGYYTVDPVLEPWRAARRVISVEHSEPTAAELLLDEDVRVRISLESSKLRVELAHDGDRPRAWSVAFRSPADEAFLGFGERFNRNDQRGVNVYAWPEEGGLGSGENVPKGPTNPWPNGEVMSYYPIPYFVSSQGYGFWLDSTWRNEFRLATDSPNTWRVWDTGPTTAFEIFLPIPGDSRPWPYQVLDRFTATTGRPMMPPMWSIGPRRRIGRGSMQAGVPEIQRMRDLDLALTTADDALHFLPAGSDVGVEPELMAWTASAAALGVRVLGYYNPYIARDASNLTAIRDQALANDYFLKNDDGTPSVVWLISGAPLNLYTFDVSNPAANTFFTGLFQRAFDLGYSGWMYDFGEYVQPQVRAHNGMSGEQFHNLFPVLYQKAAFDALEAGPKKGDWFHYARSGYTGSTQYVPIVWSGDPEASFDDGLGLPAMVRAGTNMGLSGVAHWGSDIGGFKCVSAGYAGADGEMLTRWIQQASLTSDMHDENACPGAKDSGTKATLWSAPSALAAWKTYARLHTRLFPYIYTLAVEAHATGAPTMRHPFFEHPTPQFAAVDDSYYFGTSLLVAPVVRRGARSREVLLPDETFLDWTVDPPALVKGPGKVTVDAPLDRLPLFLRDGHLVPLLDPTIDTLDDRASHPGVVAPRDVADVYDVVGLISTRSARASFSVYDGSRFEVSYQGGLQPAAGVTIETIAGKLRRVRASIAPGGAPLDVGGLRLSSSASRTARFELYVAD